MPIHGLEKVSLSVRSILCCTYTEAVSKVFAREVIGGNSKYLSLVRYLHHYFMTTFALISHLPTHFLGHKYIKIHDGGLEFPYYTQALLHFRLKHLLQQISHSPPNSIQAPQTPTHL